MLVTKEQEAAREKAVDAILDLVSAIIDSPSKTDQVKNRLHVKVDVEQKILVMGSLGCEWPSSNVLVLEVFNEKRSNANDKKVEALLRDIKTRLQKRVSK